MVDQKNLALSMVEMQSNNTQYAGLKVLEGIDGLFIEQEWEAIETFTGGLFESANKYTIYDPTGKIKLFRAKEKTNCCFRQCCSESRPFKINIYDHTGDKDKLALTLKRRYRGCGWAAIPCCAHSVGVHYMIDDDGQEVKSTNSDTLISKVQVPWCGGCFVPTLNLLSRDGDKQASIKGPTCFVCDCCGADFNVYNNENEQIGELKKLRVAGLKDLAMEMATDADKFHLTFPKDLSPQAKMAILAATFQIDFTFFEDDRTPCRGRCCDIYCCGWACPCLPRIPFLMAASKKKKKDSGAPEPEGMER